MFDLNDVAQGGAEVSRVAHVPSTARLLDGRPGLPPVLAGAYKFCTAWAGL